MGPLIVVLHSPGFDHLPGLVAEVAARTRIQDDGGHGWQDTGADAGDH